MDVQFCPHIVNWPCLSNSEWAAWIQVTGALAALALAIYVPVRMRRLEELDRRQSILDALRMIQQLADHYADTVPIIDAQIGTAPVELATAIVACQTHLTNPATPASMLPSLGHVEHAARQIVEHWNMAASAPERRIIPEFVTAANAPRDRVVKHVQAMIESVNRWKASHRLSLLMS
ncbi:hypothetical protein PDM28_07750 [Stenotrophomonas aracearum]|jgi:hypothetical protein|uniref:Transmembrane protein n=1 Tax=Stenotrophomonas aracearum TaxID=3003272 RepID=A0ABY9YH25_9GAMM|nr:hypothetical protein [Stenotrophomonas sp. A5588]WNH50171.1 hypothetical protein PDM28_07750 [Stenotrophomonas sp. A5588]